MKGKLYLIPCPLGEIDPVHHLPRSVFESAGTLRHFIVEKEKTARRFLKTLDLPYPIQEAVLFELDKHDQGQDIGPFFEPALAGHDTGLISEAGVPAVADPGSNVVRLAHKLGITVEPLTGPSSILLAIMASGLNGQNFAFNGYLPIEKGQRISKLRQLEERIRKEGQSQLFMDTPFRNDQLLSDLIQFCSPGLSLCIAAEVTLPGQFISTRTLAEWKKNKPALHKRPTMFVLGS